RVQAAGMIVREVSRTPSNWRSEIDLIDYLESNNIVAIADVDTRRLTRLLRDKGAQNGCIMAGDVDVQAALDQARACSGLEGLDLATDAGTSESYAWTEPGPGASAAP